MSTIELLTPSAGDKTWRVRINHGDSRALPFTTSIELEEPTKRVVELLQRMFKGARIKAPNGETIHPKPPGGYPALLSFQRSER